VLIAVLCERDCEFKAKESCRKTRGPFLKSPNIFSGLESYFVCAMFTSKTQILFVLKAVKNSNG